MGFLGSPHGIFRLRQSDDWCGSYLPTSDAADVLSVGVSAFPANIVRNIRGEPCIADSELQKAWAAGRIKGAPPTKIGPAQVSLDEMIVIALVRIALPDAVIEQQVPMGRLRVDLRITCGSDARLVEFLGPGHFVRSYGRDPSSPTSRRQRLEQHFGVECVLWPYWIQRCIRNVLVIFEKANRGLASVWSTNALFGDFVVNDAAGTVEQLTSRFDAIRPGGIGYMYTNEEVHNKPFHPIVQQLRDGWVSPSKMVPPGSYRPQSFWLPPIDPQTADVAA